MIDDDATTLQGDIEPMRLGTVHDPDGLLWIVERDGAGTITHAYGPVDYDCPTDEATLTTIVARASRRDARADARWLRQALAHC